MYTNEERKKRVEELDPIAKDLIMNKRPGDARKMISEMCPEDAYTRRTYWWSIRGRISHAWERYKGSFGKCSGRER